MGACGDAVIRRIVHCDWSTRAAGRWMAVADRMPDGGWRASGPAPVPAPAELVDALVAAGREGPVLAAFDCPIGIPARFGEETGFGSFAAMLDALGRGAWPDLFTVAATPGEVGPRRPFYPARPGGARLRHLLEGHGVETVDDLVRACERAGPDGGAAGCMFWTLGAKQVGKAALFAWREVVVPARRRGAHLWPFEGDLAELAGQGGLTLAESYPGDAYGQLGFRIRNKRDRALRAALAPHLLGWAAARRVRLADDLSAAVLGGFPVAAGGDDGFDAAMGLLAAIAVVDGERPAGPPPGEGPRRWEGWILGRRVWDGTAVDGRGGGVAD